MRERDDVVNRQILWTERRSKRQRREERVDSLFFHAKAVGEIVENCFARLGKEYRQKKLGHAARAAHGSGVRHEENERRINVRRR